MGRQRDDTRTTITYKRSQFATPLLSCTPPPPSVDPVDARDFQRQENEVETMPTTGEKEEAACSHLSAESAVMIPTESFSAASNNLECDNGHHTAAEGQCHPYCAETQTCVEKLKV